MSQHILYSEHLDSHAVSKLNTGRKEALGKKSCPMYRAPLPAISIKAQIILSINRYSSSCFVFYVSLFITAITIIAIVYDYCCRMAPSTPVSFDRRSIAFQTFANERESKKIERGIIKLLNITSNQGLLKNKKMFLNIQFTVSKLNEHLK